MLPILPTLAEQRRDTNIGALQAADREEDEHVEAAKPDRVDREKVTGEDRVALLAQECAPAVPVALRRGREAGVGEHDCAPASPRRRRRACAARRRSGRSPSSCSRAPAARSAHAPCVRSAAGPADGADTSSGARPDADASAATSPAAPGTHSKTDAAPPRRSPPTSAGRAARTAADPPAGARPTTRAEARESQAPSNDPYGREAPATQTADKRRDRATTQATAASKDGNADATATPAAASATPAEFPHPTGSCVGETA
jgi:hypothetical protein